MTRAKGIEQLREEHAEHGPAIRHRLEEFQAVPPSRYFYELVYCLLTPQSSAVHAAHVVAALEDADRMRLSPDLAELLRRPDHYIRFHNTKARRISLVREQMPRIQEEIRREPDPVVLRSWLVGEVNGFGLKEASHFLRNIGRRDLAILDRHILRNLQRLRVIRTLPSTLSRVRYLEIEAAFARFARSTGIPMDELDLLFWRRETGRILK